jgi:hypothetical protein
MTPKLCNTLLVLSSIVLAGCGAADDEGNPTTQPAPTENRCTMTVTGDAASEVGEHTFEMVSSIPPQGVGREPLIAASHRPVAQNSNLHCFQFTTNTDLIASFSITYPGKLDRVIPVEFDQNDEGFELIHVSVNLGERSWQCQGRNEKSYSPFEPEDSSGTFSGTISSAVVGIDTESISWFAVHGTGTAECEGEEDTPGRVTVAIAY